MMQDTLSPKQIAQAIGVSEASLKRWCDQGKIASTKTAGGHRRIPVSEVIQFLRETGHRLVDPGVLGLPVSGESGQATLERTAELFAAALERGNEEQCRRLVLNLYLGGSSTCDICDQVIAGAFHRLGDRWQHGEAEVYQERRGCEIAMRIMLELRLMLSALPDDAPLAIGGTLEYDPYNLATTMVELSLREVGWRGESHGCGNPVETLCAAVYDKRPRLFWLSVSCVPSVPAFLDDYNRLYAAATDCGAALAIGGRALTEELRRELTYSAYCDTLRHLVAFVRTLHKS